jgi:hypothetical protein
MATADQKALVVAHIAAALAAKCEQKCDDLEQHRQTWGDKAVGEHIHKALFDFKYVTARLVAEALDVLDSFDEGDE